MILEFFFAGEIFQDLSHGRQNGVGVEVKVLVAGVAVGIVDLGKYLSLRIQKENARNVWAVNIQIGVVVQILGFSSVDHGKFGAQFLKFQTFG